MNQALWQIRREFWENREIWIMPLALGAIMLLAALFGRVDIDLVGMFPAFVAAARPDPGHFLGGVVLLGITVLFFTALSLYSGWYFLDCLYAERKDRSILFWKSLPVSDTLTVLVKLAMGLVVIPCVYWACADLTTVLIAFVLSIRGGAALVGGLWRIDLWIQLQILWLYVIVTVALWFAPVAAWLMLASAWAKRAVMLWSLLPLLVLIVAEAALLGSWRTADVLGARLGSGYFNAAFSSGPGSDVWHWINPVGFLSTPAVWYGIAVAVVLLVATIQVRRRRSDI